MHHFWRVVQLRIIARKDGDSYTVDGWDSTLGLKAVNAKKNRDATDGKPSYREGVKLHLEHL